MKGQIVKIHSDLHYVQVEKDIYSCKCRGIFRKEKILPLVGDYVEFDSKKHVIEKVLPRKNEFKRPKVSNIDQAFLITSLVSPDFSLNLLDKLLVLMELHSVHPIICITKRDMINCLGTALISLGLKGKRIGVIGENRYEWELAYLSVVCGVGIVVPMDKSLPANELEEVIERSEVEAIFYSNKYEEKLGCFTLVKITT